MLSKFCDIRNEVVRFSQNGDESILQKTKASHCHILQFMADVQNRISQVISEINELEFDILKTALNEAIQRHTPIKQRYVRENQAPFIYKT